MTHDKVFFLLKTFFLKFYFLSLCCMSNIFRNCFWKICRKTAASSRLSNVRRYYIGFALWLVQKIGAPFQPIRWKRKQTTTKSLTFLRALGCLPIHNWVLQAKFNVFLYSLWSISHLPTSHHYDYLTTRVVFFFPLQFVAGVLTLPSWLTAPVVSRLMVEETSGDVSTSSKESWPRSASLHPKLVLVSYCFLVVRGWSQTLEATETNRACCTPLVV